MPSLGIWDKADIIGEKLADSKTFTRIVDFFSSNFTGIFLEKTENGYMKELDGVEVEMTHQFHFTDIIIHSPIEGYTKELDLENTDRLLDAGAFPGALAIIAAKRGAEVIALEPDPQNADQLRKNLELNNVQEKVEVVEVGLWKEKDQKSFERDQALGMASRIKEEAEITIQLDTLDSVTEEHGRPDLVKMDIEGAETEALEGAEKTLEQTEPDFEIATYHLDEEGNKTYHEIEEKLSEKGYNVKTGFSRHLTTYASKNREFN